MVRKSLRVGDTTWSSLRLSPTFSALAPKPALREETNYMRGGLPTRSAPMSAVTLYQLLLSSVSGNQHLLSRSKFDSQTNPLTGCGETRVPGLVNLSVNAVGFQDKTHSFLSMGSGDREGGKSALSTRGSESLLGCTGKTSMSSEVELQLQKSNSGCLSILTQEPL